MRKLLMPFLAILALLFIPLTAVAQGQAQDQRVQIRLLAEKGQVSGGDEIWIGIEQVITPHWHTYWKNPGDSGTITKADWTLPEGSEISDIYWPTPKRLPFGPLMNYGYEDNVVLLQKLKLPDTLPDGEIVLSADIELLVCKEECIPEYGTYTLSLNDENSQSEDNTGFFENATSKLPRSQNWEASFFQDDQNFHLNITLPEKVTQAINLETVEFYPADWGLVENAKPQSAKIDAQTLTIKQSKGERNYQDLKTATFILTYKDQNQQKQSVEISAKPKMKAAVKPQEQSILTTNDSTITIAQALLFAILGGLILNLMPCVFPVLSIKALSLVKIADKDPALAKMHGIAYTAGVIISFLAIAGTLLVLKSAGSQIGWGFQLQNPMVVGALAYLLFIIGLNLMGYFEFGNSLGNVGNKLTQGQGLNSSFFTGVLATLVATPCTAPFMAGAIGFALTQTALVNLAIFTALGFGLALPYLALSFAPALQKVMPKPGAWMDTFKQFLAFPMFAAAIWLVWVLSKQAGSTGVLQILSGMGLIGFSIWLLKVTESRSSKAVSVLLLVIAAFMLIIPTAQTPQSDISNDQSQEFGEVFSTEKLNTLLTESDHPVFVEMTAAWCITCKANHAIAINIPSTKKAFAQNNVHYLIGDWTNQDPDITRYLNAYKRNGVPIYVYYAARNKQTGQRPDAKILPQILTPATLSNLF